VSADVFAYGSNMWPARFREYGVHPEAAGMSAMLPAYRLAFNKASRKDGSGKANVEPNPDAAVWGVIYRIPDADLEALDRGEVGYERQAMRVYTAAGVGVTAWVYVATAGRVDPRLRPYTWYKQFLIEGAKEHGLPPTYVAALEAIPADEDPDRARDQERRELM
jgi:cation transport regulator ChaC